MADVPLELMESVPLAPRTTLGLGGPARFFAQAASRGEMLAALRWAADREFPVFILGGGSNLVVGDAGFPAWSCTPLGRDRDGAHRPPSSAW